MQKNLPYSSSLPRLLRLAYSALKTNNDAGAVYGPLTHGACAWTLKKPDALLR